MIFCRLCRVIAACAWGDAFRYSPAACHKALAERADRRQSAV
jgi:hypothetical protein